jgi:hypothetical protein
MNDDPNRLTAIARCRNLERRFIRIQHATGGDHSIAINWAREWAMAMLDTTRHSAFYVHWIGEQERRADRFEAMIEAKQVQHANG